MSRVPHPAPWTCRVRALLWWRPLPPAEAARVAATIAPPLRRRALPVMVAAGLLDYHDTPVGPYSEVLAAVGLATVGGPTVHVPFLAVDSAASADAGRTNWALPKVMAHFATDPDDGRSASGDGWRLTARPGRTGPPLPVPLVGRLAQLGAQGRLLARLTGGAAARPCRVDVEVDRHHVREGPPAWLPAGRVWGADVTGTFILSAARRG